MSHVRRDPMVPENVIHCLMNAGQSLDSTKRDRVQTLLGSIYGLVFTTTLKASSSAYSSSECANNELAMMERYRLPSKCTPTLHGLCFCFHDGEVHVCGPAYR
jgi:hypothetical protein